MKANLIIFAVLVGLAINVFLVIIPPSKQLATFRGFDQPKDSEFITSNQGSICNGMNYTVEKSISRVGYPLGYNVNANFSHCSYISRSNKIDLFSESINKPTFYVNWLIWAALSYVGLILVFRLYPSRK